AELDAAMAALEKRLAAGGAAALGEIGLDYSHGEDAADRARQRALFAAQLRLAAKLALPCSIHSRDAEEDTLALLRENLSPELSAAGRAGSLHCFVGSPEFAAALAPLGLCFGLSGIVTFRSADALRAVVPLLPRDRILVETDSPYLAPVPLRGRPCEPAFVVHTARRVADLLNLPEPEAFALFTANARRVFAPA
ncbi:MAG: TatD family hydrolase, partial [Kiritimatiellae bacterium]|nr:TatD family hydrolase [Kiritimatiellia bacterium]